MDSLNIVKIKAEKANALRRDRQLRKITGLFRIIEICIVLVLVSRVSAQLPAAIKNSGAYFRNLSMVLVSPRFVFLLGNVILIVLLAKSGYFSAQESCPKSVGTDLYDEFVEKSKKNEQSGRFEMEYQQKQRKTEDINSIVFEDSTIPHVAKNYRRSQSENKMVDVCEKPRRMLSRSETEKCQKIICYVQEAEKNPCPEDKMSNEEFRSKIEAFIARQQRFRREEEDYSVL